MPYSWDAVPFRLLTVPASPILRTPVGEFDECPNSGFGIRYEWVLWAPGVEPPALVDSFRNARRWRALRHHLGRTGGAASLLAIATSLLALSGPVAGMPVTLPRLPEHALVTASTVMLVSAALLWRRMALPYDESREVAAWARASQGHCVYWRQVLGYSNYRDTADLVRLLATCAAINGTDEAVALTEAHHRVWFCVAHGEPAPAEMTAVRELLERLISTAIRSGRRMRGTPAKRGESCTAREN